MADDQKLADALRNLAEARATIAGLKRGADRLADEVAALVRLGRLDSRSPAADALLDYREPPSTERADALAEREATIERLEKEAVLNGHDHDDPAGCGLCMVIDENVVMRATIDALRAGLEKVLACDHGDEEMCGCRDSARAALAAPGTDHARRIADRAELVERIAKGIHTRLCTGSPPHAWEDITESPHKAIHRETARAALAAVDAEEGTHETRT